MTTGMRIVKIVFSFSILGGRRKHGCRLWTSLLLLCLGHRDDQIEKKKLVQGQICGKHSVVVIIQCRNPRSAQKYSRTSFAKTDIFRWTDGDTDNFLRFWHICTWANRRKTHAIHYNMLCVHAISFGVYASRPSNIVLIRFDGLRSSSMLRNFDRHVFSKYFFREYYYSRNYDIIARTFAWFSRYRCRRRTHGRPR